jgi:hypothetical protein
LVSLAWKREDCVAVDWFQRTKPEILKLRIAEFPVTSFTSITGLLEKAA